MRLKTLAGALGLSWLLGVGAASAAEGDGLKVGLATAGGELAGMVVGGGVGLSLGVLGCELSRSWECYLPVLTSPVGGAAGGFGGAVLASGWSARRLGLDHRKPRRWTLAAGGVGFGVSAVGLVTGSTVVMGAGALVGGIGMPIAAGLATRDAGPELSRWDGRVRVALSPVASARGVGLRLDGSF